MQKCFIRLNNFKRLYETGLWVYESGGWVYVGVRLKDSRL